MGRRFKCCLWIISVVLSAELMTYACFRLFNELLMPIFGTRMIVAWMWVMAPISVFIGFGTAPKVNRGWRSSVLDKTIGPLATFVVGATLGTVTVAVVAWGEPATVWWGRPTPAERLWIGMAVVSLIFGFGFRSLFTPTKGDDVP